MYHIICNMGPYLSSYVQYNFHTSSLVSRMVSYIVTKFRNNMSRIELLRSSIVFWTANLKLRIIQYNTGVIII